MQADILRFLLYFSMGTVAEEESLEWDREGDSGGGGQFRMTPRLLFLFLATDWPSWAH